MKFEDFKKDFDEKLAAMSDSDIIKSFEDMGCKIEIIMKLKEIQDIPQDWKRLTVRKKTSVKIRPCNGVERFKVSWADHDLVGDPETDIIVIANDGREYPHKKDIFWDVYESKPKLPGGCVSYDIWDYEYVKKGTNVIVEIPEGTTPFEVETLEGIVGDVGYPNYVVIGAKGELYVNTREFVETQLEIVN